MTVEPVSEVARRQHLVKICGLREPEHAAAAARAGADLLGFIFAPSRRQVSAESARVAINAARQAAGNWQVATVGVFVDADPGAIERIVTAAGLDIVQLHGAESPRFVNDFPFPVIKVLRPQPGTSRSEILAEANAFRELDHPPLALLIEGFSPRAAGGAGVKADWDLAAGLCTEGPVLLAGGLDTENVGEAIHEVGPLGVDVSSGVEIDGSKSVLRIEQFIHAAQQAYLHRPLSVTKPLAE